MHAGAKEGKRLPFRFTGTGWEYFKIWIVNIFLSIITLYVYSAWAKVRTKRYFYGNTLLDGNSFEYHAKPLQILIGRILAVIVFLAFTFGELIHPIVAAIAAVVLIIALPWITWRSMRFNARMSSYRNVRFGFTGPLSPLYKYLLVYPFLPLLVGAIIVGALVLGFGMPTFDSISMSGQPISITIVAVVIAAVFLSYAIVPLVHRLMSSYGVNNHQFGVSKFGAVLSTRSYYAIYLRACLIVLAVLVVLGAITALAQFVPGMENTLVTIVDAGALDSGGALAGLLVGMLVLAIYAFMGVVTAFVVAFFRSRIRNYTHRQTLLDGRIDLESTIEARPLAWLMITNFVAIVITLGLAYPWAKVRMARFYANHTAVYSTEPLDNFVNAEREKVSALGEEFGDAFDMDVDVAL